MQTVQQAPKHIAAPPVSADGYINVAKVSKSYGGEGFTKTVVRNCSFTYRAGEAHGDDRPLGLRENHPDPTHCRI